MAELLVVISIVSLLASVIFTTVNGVRADARNQTRKQTTHEVRTAIDLYHLNTGSLPADTSTGALFAAEGTTEYNAVMDELVNAGVLADTPEVDGTTGGFLYYQNEGDNLTPGDAEFVTLLEGSPSEQSGMWETCETGPWFVNGGMYWPHTVSGLGSNYTVTCRNKNDVIVNCPAVIDAYCGTPEHYEEAYCQCSGKLGGLVAF